VTWYLVKYRDYFLYLYVYYIYVHRCGKGTGDFWNLFSGSMRSRLKECLCIVVGHLEDVVFKK
jgi:hypothetical protein